MPTAAVEPLALVNTSIDDLAKLAESALGLVEPIEQKLGRVVDEEVYARLRRLASTGSVNEAANLIEAECHSRAGQLVPRLEASLRVAVEEAIRTGTSRRLRALLQPGLENPIAVLDALARLAHLAFLVTGRIEARDVAVILYAVARTLQLPRHEDIGRALLYLLAATLFLLNGHRVEALALAGWAIRGRLRVRPPSEAGSIEAWASAITASYLLDVAPDVDGRLLDAWGFYEIIEKNTRVESLD